MLKSRRSLAAAGAALLTPMLAPVAAHAACSAYVTSTPDLPGDPSLAGSVTTTLRAAAINGTRPSLRQSQAAAAVPAWPESAPKAYTTDGPPEAVIIVPSSVLGSEPACASDTFGAPIAAQSMRHTRDRLSQTHNKLAQLRTPNPQAGGLKVHLSGSDQSRREGGDADTGTLALRVSRVDVNMGADYRFNDRWVAGGSMGLGNPRMRWDGNPSRVDGQSGNLTAYSLWSPSPAGFVSAAFSLESTHYAVHTDEFEHETTGVNMGLSLSAGYDFQQGSWTFSPYVRADEVASRIGSFGSEGRRTRGRTGSVSLGSQVQTTVPTSWGLIAPHARLEFTQITGWHIQGDSAATYAAGISVLPTPNPLALDRQFGVFGIGASAVLQRGLTLFTDYDTGFAQKAVSTWRLTFGLRSEL